MDSRQEIIAGEKTRQDAREYSLSLTQQGLVQNEEMEVGAMRELLAILRRQKHILLAFVAAALMIAAAILLFFPKQYEATALIKVDRHQLAVVTGLEGNSSGPGDEMDQIITTEIELAQTDNVLRPVAEKYHLLDLEGQTKRLSPEKVERLKAAPIQLNQFKIERPANTLLLRITYRANDPKLAAEIANALAASLILHSNEAAEQSLHQTEGQLNANLDALQKQIDAETKKLGDYEQQLGVIDPEHRITALNTQLLQLNTELAQVEGQKADLEASVRQLGTGDNLATLQTLDSLRSINDNSLNECLTRLEAAKQQLALAASYYGESHPEYIKAKQQVDELTSQLNSRMANSRERIHVAYRQIVAREASLNAMIADVKQDLDNMESKGQQYDALKSQVDNDHRLYQEISGKALLAGINRQYDSATLRLVTPARVPKDHVSPKGSIVLSVALVASLFLGVLLVVVVHLLRGSFINPDEIVKQLHMNVLATLPNTKQIPKFLDSAETEAGKPSKRLAAQIGSYQEGIRTLRAFLNQERAHNGLRVVAVTSAMPDEGKSTVVAQLAKSMALTNKKVLLIDANLRRPTLHNQCSVRQSPGLLEVLAGTAPIQNAIVPSKIPGLSILPAGRISQDAPEVILNGMAHFLAHVSINYDLILLDCSPVHGAAETVEIASLVDGVLFVIQSNGAPGKQIADAISKLNKAHTRVVGVVLNHSETEDSNCYSFYSADDSDAKYSRVKYQKKAGA